MTGSRGASWEVQMTKRVCRRGTSAGSFLLKCLAVEQFPEHIFSSCHQAAELFTLLSVSPSAPSCYSSKLQAQKDKTPSVVVSACSLAFPSHLQGGEKCFLHDENFVSWGRMPQQGLVSARGPSQELSSLTDLREIQGRVLRL